MGWRVPFGSKKQGVSRFVLIGMFGSRLGSKLAPLNSEYGTIIIGFVGSARNGC